MDRNYCYKISRSLTRLIMKLAGHAYKATFFSAEDDISLYYIVSLRVPVSGKWIFFWAE